MSLPWFPFHLDAYTGDTMHLTTEEHGAYLLLMIAYYRTEKPLPGYDRALASICKLPLDRWLITKVALEPFFRIDDGLWHHDRIDAELRDASEKHAARIAQRSAAAQSRWGKNAGRTTKPMRPASGPVSETDKPSEPKPPRNAARNTARIRPEYGSDAQEQEQIVVGGGVSRARDPGPSLADIEDALPMTPADLGTPVDLWKPQGIDPGDIDLLNRFVTTHIERGTFSRDWPSLWRKYLDDAKAPPKPRKGKPHIEVNKRPEPIPGKRVTISQEAKDLSGEIERLLGLEGQPVTVGFPMLMETWLAGWPAEIILTTIQQVMAQREARGEGPPSTMKYFETPISRAVAEFKRPLPVTTIVPPKEITAHATASRPRGQSVSEAAGRLAEQFAALTGGGSSDGALEGEIVGRAIPEK